jgi:hypothetical protein
MCLIVFFVLYFTRLFFLCFLVQIILIYNNYITGPNIQDLMEMYSISCYKCDNEVIEMIVCFAFIGHYLDVCVCLCQDVILTVFA